MSVATISALILAHPEALNALDISFNANLYTVMPISFAHLTRFTGHIISRPPCATDLHSVATPVLTSSDAPAALKVAFGKGC